MKLADMITAAGGLTEGAFQTTTEVSRTDLSSPERATTETIAVDLSADSLASFALNALDRALFKTTPDYRDKETIVLSGEVMFPGEYPLNRGETLSSVIERAGGFTEIAHIEAAAFTRESLRSREEKELARLKELLEQQMVAEQIEDSNTEDSKVTAEQQKLREQAIDDLDSTEAVGRLVIPLLEIVSGRAEDVILENGDALHVPKYRQEVSVIGEVQQPTSYFYNKNLSLQDYIDRSGGLLQGADSDSVYLVKASGEVVVPKRKVSGFFRRRPLVEPGDTIVVPLDTDAERLKGVRLLTEVSQIIYQLSLGAAAIRSLN
jgi:protein involved in polysaccharide export with SLBB domain